MECFVCASECVQRQGSGHKWSGQKHWAVEEAGRLREPVEGTKRGGSGRVLSACEWLCTPCGNSPRMGHQVKRGLSKAVKRLSIVFPVL